MKKEFRELLENENSPLFEGLFDALETEPSVSVRVNRSKIPISKIEELDRTCKKVPWHADGYYLDTRRDFTHDPAFHQGTYYVQDASSMIHGEMVRRLAEMNGNAPLRVLDSCAAPGGKTTAIIAGMPVGSSVIANEYDFRRAEILKENVFKWGCPSVAVTRGDTKRFRRLKNLFDIVVADVPCSGEGMFRKDDEARRQWSPQLVRQCAILQREILDNLMDCVKPGGYVLYSTCTFNTAENEKNVEFFCERYGLETVDMSFPEEWKLGGAVNSEIHCYRFLPSKISGEGLFVCVLKKSGELKITENKGRNVKDKNLCKDWVNDLVTEEKDGVIWGATRELASLIEDMEKKGVDFLTRGVEIAFRKGKDIVPSHSLALSSSYRRGSFTEIEVDSKMALEFLRKDTFRLPEGTEKGYVLLVYDGQPLGFVKNLGNRINNLLPKEWRIRI